MIEGLTFRKRPEPCVAGHERHETIVVRVRASGARFHDFAFFPDDRAFALDFEVYDERAYSETTGYCIGRSAVGHAIREQQMWESYETRIALEIFATGQGTVLDFGCNQGWYTCLAAMRGHRVVGFDSEAETLAICRRNLERNGLTAELVECWIDAESPVLPVTEDVLLVKADVEGAEFDVVRVCRNLFRERRVQYALLEISPCFKPGYDFLLESLIDIGYDCFMVPHKNLKNREAFGANPLAALEPTRLPRHKIGRWVQNIRQENVLMVRR